jgi:hypothetical protein
MKILKKILRKLSMATICGATLFGVYGMTAHTANAATYYACQSGFKFEVKSNAARCYKAAYYAYKALNACPRLGGIGYGLVQDYKSGSSEDFCVSQSPVSAGVQATLPTGCPKGYRKQTRPKSKGKDRCRKRIGAQIKAPSRSVKR